MTRANSFAAPKISIQYDNISEFIKTDNALNVIKSQPIGRELLNEINSLSCGGRSIIIQISEKTTSIPNLTYKQIEDSKTGIENISGQRNVEIACQLSKQEKYGGHSIGVSSIIKWNPSFNIDIDKNGFGFKNYESENGFISLTHELIHSLRIMSGMTVASNNRDMYKENSMGRIEENTIIGIAGHESEKFTENKIREEHGLPNRVSWDSINNVDNSQLIQFLKDNNLVKESQNET